MKCELIRAIDLAQDAVWCRYLRDHLTRPGGHFHAKLDAWASGQPAGRGDGWLSIVTDQGEPVGWARTEIWWEQPGEIAWDTLESFVAPQYRGRGISSWAASGLTAAPLQDDRVVAVFRPAMLLVARRADLHPVLFESDDEGCWVRA